MIELKEHKIQEETRQAPDYCFGMMHTVDELLEFLDAAYSLKDCKRLKLGDNYMFLNQNKDINFHEGICMDKPVRFSEYKATMVITENIYDTVRGEYVKYRTVFGTNDQKKIKKYMSCYEATHLESDEVPTPAQEKLYDDIESGLQGAIFPSYTERLCLAKGGMFLG